MSCAAPSRKCVWVSPFLSPGLTLKSLQGVLSPLLFNLLVNGLAAAVRRSAPGVQLQEIDLYLHAGQNNLHDSFGKSSDPEFQIPCGAGRK